MSEEEKNITEENPKTPDEQWAEKLGVPNKVSATPPPTPSGAVSEPEAPSRQHSGLQQPPAYNPQYQEAQTPRHPQRFSGFPLRNQPANDTEEPMPPTYLIWSILCTLLCCFIPGIVAIFFSSKVSSRYYAGDMEGAKKNSRRAEIWIIVSFVLGLLTNTLYLPLMMVSGS